MKGLGTGRKGNRPKDVQMDIQISTYLQSIIYYSPTHNMYARTIFRIRTYMYPLVTSLYICMYLVYSFGVINAIVTGWVSVGVGVRILHSHSDRHSPDTTARAAQIPNRTPICKLIGVVIN